MRCLVEVDTKDNRGLKVYIFSVLISERVKISRGGPTSMICDIKNSLEANLGPMSDTYAL